jgi:hypothetical protein
MISTVENPTLPASRDSVESTISNARTNDLKQNRVIFFAGDVISPREKYLAPATAGFGGISRGDLKTIQHNGNLGMVYRCKFTIMRTKMIDEPKDMLDPKDIKNWETSYILSNGKLGPNGWEDVQIGGTKETSYLVYKPRYPGEEMRFALQRNEPNGEGGTVEIASLKGADYATVREAQLFFFPNWAEIERGEAKLPPTIRELEILIRSRMGAIRELPVEKQNQYASIANDIIKSCTEYRMWGLNFLKFCEDAINEAKIKGMSYSYPVKAEMILEQLEQKRKDDLVSGEHSATNSLVEEMRLDRAEKNNLEQRRLELEERKLRLEEIKAGIRNPNEMDVVPVAEEVENTVFYCGAPKANGEPCQREVEQGTKCFQHGE